MADKKLTQLDEITTIASEDLIYVVDDPSGTPIEKNAPVSKLLDAQFITMTADGKLTSERVATAGNGISVTDGTTIVTFALTTLTTDWDAGSHKITAGQFETTGYSGSGSVLSFSGTTTGTYGAYININHNPTTSLAMGYFQSYTFDPGVSSTIYANYLEAILGTTSDSLTSFYGAYISVTSVSGYTGTLSDSYLLRLHEGSWLGSNPANSYGLYISDVDGGTSTNYAIYTNSGEVRFGDTVIFDDPDDSGYPVKVYQNSWAGAWGVTSIVLQPTAEDTNYPGFWLNLIAPGSSESDRTVGLSFEDGDNTAIFTLFTVPDTLDIYTQFAGGGDFIVRDDSNAEIFRFTQEGEFWLEPIASEHGVHFKDGDQSGAYGWNGLLLKPAGIGAATYYEKLFILLEPYNNTATERSTGIYFRDSGDTGVNFWGGIQFSPTNAYFDFGVRSGDTHDLLFRGGGGYNTLFRMTYNGRFGIGVDPDVAGYPLHIVHDLDNKSIMIENQKASAAGQGAGIVLYHNDSNYLADGNRLGFITFSAYSTVLGGLYTGASIESFARGAWGSADYPTSLLVKTTPDGGSARVARLEIMPDGSFEFQNDGGMVFSSIYAWYNSNDTGISIVSTWYQFTDFYAVGEENGNITASLSTDDITIAVAGRYLIIATGDINCPSTASQNVDVGVSVNDTVLFVRDISLIGSGQSQSFAISFYRDLAVNDTIELYVRNNVSTANLRIQNADLSATLMAGT